MHFVLIIRYHEDMLQHPGMMKWRRPLVVRGPIQFLLSSRGVFPPCFVFPDKQIPPPCRESSRGAHGQTQTSLRGNTEGGTVFSRRMPSADHTSASHDEATIEQPKSIMCRNQPTFVSAVALDVSQHQVSDPGKGVMGTGAHSDYGLITLLATVRYKYSFL